MSFLDNLLRYPMFFFSSMVGLISVLLGPFLKLIKQMPNKTVIILLLLMGLTSFCWVLKEMLNLE